MPVNTGLAHLSDQLLLVTVVAYSLAMLGYAGDLAFGRRRPATAAPTPAPAAEPVREPQPAAMAAGAARPGPAAADVPPPPADALGGRSHREPAGWWVRAAVALTAAGLAAHVAVIVTRGLAAHRVPWGNMYEFVTAITAGAVTVFLALVLRYRTHFLGLFVMIPVVTGLGLAAVVLYTPAGPLMPALQSYWIAIHVTAAIVASGAFLVGATTTVLHLLATRRRAAAASTSAGGIMRRLPAPEVLDRLAYRTVVFGFPIWTFAVIAGAIWADEAWGRYWGWDPKETWSFITWVAYAAYLHARATAGWRGRRAAWIQLAAFAALIFNLVGVNIWITGLHSYAGVS